MTRRTVIVLALCLLWVALQPSPTARTEVRSMSVGQPQVWTGLSPAVDAQTWWYATQPAPTPTTTVARVRRSGTVTAAVYGTGACGGDLPPCSVMWCESHGSLTAQNPHSTASGKWQILDSTWGGYGGYSRAMYAPESVQDARAREIYAGGAGRGAWVC